jgi:hypothetical protein
MSALGLLWWLIVSHAVGDFVLQDETMAKGKNRNLPGQTGVPWFYWLSAHALVQGGGVAIVLGSPVLGLSETIAHWVIDFGKCEDWYGLNTDQALHGLCKIIWLTIYLGIR